jgi:hypothetical protein
MGVTMQRVTASQASFSIVIGEPGHTKPRAAKVRSGKGYCGLVCTLLSTLIEGLSVPLKTGNRPYQPLCRFLELE